MKMKIIRVYSMVVFVILLLSCEHSKNTNNLKSSTSSRQKTLTELKFKNKLIDFGEVYVDTILVASYTMYNIGKVPLIIDYVNPDCICTKHMISKDTVAIGDSAVITLEMDTKDKYGDIKLYTTVCANTGSKFYKLTMKATVL